MKRRTFLKQIVSTAALYMTGVPLLRAENAGKPPNIIFILTDDQGWTSVSYRSDPMNPDSKSDYIETPQMARAARQGMRFTSGYAPNAQCSPTRHSILFGQNAARHIYGKDLQWTKKAPNWLTIPKVLKAANPAYRAAHFGKWHVAVTPAEAGFDFSDGPTSNYEGIRKTASIATRNSLLETCRNTIKATASRRPNSTARSPNPLSTITTRILKEPSV